MSLTPMNPLLVLVMSPRKSGLAVLPSTLISTVKGKVAKGVTTAMESICESLMCMDKLMGLDGDVEILPGHGGVSDIATERTHNPFLQPFNEPDDPDLSVEI